MKAAVAPLIKRTGEVAQVRRDGFVMNSCLGIKDRGLRAINFPRITNHIMQPKSLIYRGVQICTRPTLYTTTRRSFYISQDQVDDKDMSDEKKIDDETLKNFIKAHERAAGKIEETMGSLQGEMGNILKNTNMELQGKQTYLKGVVRQVVNKQPSK